ncbi:phage tail protein [Ligilactobacillus salivarius]|nr:phage tail protein [Ligilactobacillus salivarius]
MRLSTMTERITFYSISSGIDPKTHRQIANKEQDEFSCWCEVSKLTVRETVKAPSEMGFRKETPVFLIAYKQQKEIQPEWRIKWRGKRYEITGIDPDYQNKDLTKVTGQVIN